MDDLGTFSGVDWVESVVVGRRSVLSHTGKRDGVYQFQIDYDTLARPTKVSRAGFSGVDSYQRIRYELVPPKKNR